MSKALLCTAACTAAVALLVSACGDDNEGTSGGATAGSSAEAGGLADKSAEEILTAAKSALAGAESVRISGEGIFDGSAIELDLALDADAGGAGTVTIDGQQLQLVVTADTAYLKGDEGLYSSLGGAELDLARLLAGKWVSLPADHPNAADMVQFADPQAFADLIEAEGTISKGESDTINGVAAISLIDDAATDASVLWIATEGEAYPLRLNLADDESQAIDFTGYGEPVEITPPPADQVVDLSELAGTAA